MTWVMLLSASGYLTVLSGALTLWVRQGQKTTDANVARLIAEVRGDLKAVVADVRGEVRVDAEKVSALGDRVNRLEGRGPLLTR